MPVQYDDPNMSDATLLVSVEDLINRALGSPDVNTVNFKLVQMILHILARQQRMLEQRVEIRSTDLKAPPTKRDKHESESSSSKSPRSPTKRRMAGIKEEHDAKKEDKDKKQQKDKGKDDKLQQKDKGKTEKELIKSEKAAEKEKEKLEKAEKKEKERAEKQKRKMEKDEEKEAARADKKSAKKARVTSATGIAISEIQKGNENVLVVEKGPTTRSEGRGRPNIDVVTQSQFALLEAAVKELKDVAVPKPLVLPDNEKLKSDIAKGNATLPDAMQAMQVTARVKAAEDAINRMTGLLTQLAAAGALPEDIAEKVEEVKIEPPKPSEAVEPEKLAESAKSHQSVVSRKSVAIDPKASQMSRLDARPRSRSAPATPRPSQATSRQSLLSKQSTMSIGVGVTHDELNTALRELREELSKNLNSLTTRATAAAENALHTAMSVAEKLEVAMKVDARISILYSLVSDYSEQLSGFDSGLTTQMQSFQDQMGQIRADLKAGLAQLENVNNNAETAAVMELTERYQELVTDLDTTLHAHKTLTTQHSQLGGEMHSLVECVEMLREQKSDRDEVLDGLRDKADSTRLAGLLSEVEFAEARADFERRIALCHDKFNRQEAVWMAAIRDLTNITDNKAEIVDLLSARDEAQNDLLHLQEKIRILAAVLGEPKAALLTRQLAAGAACGACGAGASMPQAEPAAGQPPPLPALRPPPAGPPAGPCLADWVGAEPELERHICHRWCGGSHTRVTEATTKERPSPDLLEAVPTNKYTGYGSDGRLYMMEEVLRPCIECNLLSSDVRPPQEPGADCGAGDSPAPQTNTPIQ